MTLRELTVAELLGRLGERSPAPASGAAAALTGAVAAALVELAARFAGDDDAIASARALGDRLAALADEDASAYASFAADRSDRNRARIVAVPEEIAERADEVGELAGRVRDQLRSAVAGDAEVAALLAAAAGQAGRRLADLNR